MRVPATVMALLHNLRDKIYGRRPDFWKIDQCLAATRMPGYEILIELFYRISCFRIFDIRSNQEFGISVLLLDNFVIGANFVKLSREMIFKKITFSLAIFIVG